MSQPLFGNADNNIVGGVAELAKRRGVLQNSHFL